VTQVRHPFVSIDVLSPVDVAQIFGSLGEYIAIHEPVLDQYGTVIDARLIWWNTGYEAVRVRPVAHQSKMSEAYFEPEIAIEYASTAWSSGRAVQLFEFTPAKRNQYRPPVRQVVISVLWERVGDYLVEIGSDLSELRQLEAKLVDQRTLVFAAERDKALLADRERIARNLHDSVIQQLYASSLALNAVAARMGDFVAEPRATHTGLHTIVKHIADDLSTLIATIRDEIFDVRKELKESLRRELEDVVLPIIGPSAFEFEMHVDIDEMSDLEIVTHLRAVVREAVSNAVRHSAGSVVRIAVHRTTDDCLHLVVTDDGVGISQDVTRSNGLTNIIHRAQALGGVAEILTNAAGGTTMSWRVPVPGWSR